MTAPIDWSRPIEAVNEDGRVVAVERMVGMGDHCVSPTLEGGWFAFKGVGIHQSPLCQWRIRNVASPEQSLDMGNPISPALVERMVACLKRAADNYHVAPEARAIVADLPAEVVPVVERAVITVQRREGEHEVSLAELGRLIAGGARITSIRGRELAGEGK